MARVTVEDCLDKVENRFELVMLSSKRARQLATEGKEPFVELDNDKSTVLALREIAEGHINASLLREVDIEYGEIEDDEGLIEGLEAAIGEALSGTNESADAPDALETDLKDALNQKDAGQEDIE